MTFHIEGNRDYFRNLHKIGRSLHTLNSAFVNSISTLNYGKDVVLFLSANKRFSKRMGN
jgi:hypothetical protein